MAAVHEQPHHHHCAGHADDAADGNTLQKRPAHQHARRGAKSNGKKNAQGRAGKSNPLHAEKIGNGEFNADGKHEQDDADFGHGFKRVNVVDTQTGSEGAENKAR